MTAPEYPIETQAKLAQALCVVHNFIRIYDPQDIPELPENYIDSDGSDDNIHSGNLGAMSSTTSKSQAETFRDELAKKMFKDYKKETQR